MEIAENYWHKILHIIWKCMIYARWEDNDSIGLKEIRYEDVDWILLSQDRFQWGAFVNTVMR